MRRLLHQVYRGDPEPKRTFRVLRRFRFTGYFPRSPLPFTLANLSNLEGIMQDEEEIEVANNNERNIRDYAIFDSNAMNTRIIRP